MPPLISVFWIVRSRWKSFPTSAVSPRVRRSSSPMNPLQVAPPIASKIFVLTPRGDRRHGMKERPGYKMWLVSSVRNQLMRFRSFQNSESIQIRDCDCHLFQGEHFKDLIQKLILSIRKVVTSHTAIVLTIQSTENSRQV
jgi:hypothetical protein